MGCCGGSGRTTVRSMGRRELPQGAERTKLSIEGMMCGPCVASVEPAGRFKHPRATKGGAVAQCSRPSLLPVAVTISAPASSGNFAPPATL